jgi:hypothetical protein
MDYLTTLNQLATKFKIVPGGSGLVRTLKIDPPAEALVSGGLALSETVQQPMQVEVPLKIDLAFLGKWVRSGISDLPPDPATENPIGGMPVVDQLVGPTGLTTNLPPPTQMTSDPGQGAVPGVPEVLGRIKGTITQTVEKLTDVVQHPPIQLAVRWHVLDVSTPGVSSPASMVQYRTDPAANWQPTTPAAFPDPLELPLGGVPGMGTPMSLLLKFPALLSELTSGIPPM